MQSEFDLLAWTHSKVIGHKLIDFEVRISVSNMPNDIFVFSRDQSLTRDFLLAIDDSSNIMLAQNWSTQLTMHGDNPLNSTKSICQTVMGHNQHFSLIPSWQQRQGRWQPTFRSWGALFFQRISCGWIRYLMTLKKLYCSLALLCLVFSSEITCWKGPSFQAEKPKEQSNAWPTKKGLDVRPQDIETNL